jgi:outer membrane biosynthesis protein TonB
VSPLETSTAKEKVMRSTFRLFMAAILLTAAAGFASAQESSEPPPPPAPDAAVPVAELPPIPVAAPVQDPNAPAADPALTIDPSALPVAPAAVAIVQAPEPEMVVITTSTQRVIKKTAKKPVEKPVAKPVIEATESSGPMPAEAAVAATSTATARSDAPPPAAKSVIVETPAEGTESRTSMGIGGWLLAGIVVAAMVGLITLLRRRRTPRKTSIEFPAFGPELKSAPVTRN